MKRYTLAALICALIWGLGGCNDDNSIHVGSGQNGSSKCEGDDCDECEEGDEDCNKEPPDKEKTCPKGSLKKKPGVCGCDVEDVDENDNGIMDCKEKEDPEDPKECPDGKPKGKCGCGVEEVDENDNGIIDCLEKDPVVPPDNKCPEGSVSETYGKCGCDIEDTAENTQDSDGDGVINCLDQCPNNPKKTIPDASGCEDGGQQPTDTDTDGDTVPDSQDACPQNPDISDPIIEGMEVDCNPAPENILEIRKAEDFEMVRSKLAELTQTPTDGQACPSDDEKQCKDATTLLECHIGVWRALSCGSCDANTCNTPADGYSMPPKAYTVRVMNDINLADHYETTESGGTCTTSAWKSIPYVDSIRFEAVNNAVISFTKNNVRCTLPEALINRAVLSQFSNLTLDFDMGASARASLLNEADSTTLTNITFKGKIVTAAEQNVGGIVAQTTSSQDNTQKELVKTTLRGVHCDGASITAEKATNVGGIVGRLADATLSTDAATNKVALVKGVANVGGIVGEMSSDSDTASIENVKSEVAKVECTKKYCGGAIGVANTAGSITQVTSTLTDITAKDAEYIAGFAGGLIPKEGKLDVSKVTNTVSNVNAEGCTYSAGFVAYANKNASLQAITNVITKISGDYFTGGFVATSLGASYSNISNSVAELRAQDASMDAAFEGGFAAEARGGSFEQIVSKITAMLNVSGGSSSTLEEDQNSVGGFIASTSDAVTVRNVLSWAMIHSNRIYPGGLVGRQETSWQTENTTSMALTNVVSMGKLFQLKDAANLSSSEEKPIQAISGSLPQVTATNVYFYKRGSENALASGKGDGSFKPITSSNKSEALSALSAGWSGWKSGSITVGSETVADFPVFDAGNN